jgi:hypothetical protein
MPMTASIGAAPDIARDPGTDEAKQITEMDDAPCIRLWFVRCQATETRPGQCSY